MRLFSSLRSERSEAREGKPLPIRFDMYELDDRMKFNRKR